MAEKKEKRYVSDNAQLMADWDFDKNTSVDPAQVGCANSSKVWWKCGSCGHEWEMTIAARTRGNGCLQCAKEKRKKSK